METQKPTAFYCCGFLCVFQQWANILNKQDDGVHIFTLPITIPEYQRKVLLTPGYGTFSLDRMCVTNSLYKPFAQVNDHTVCAQSYVYHDNPLVEDTYKTFTPAKTDSVNVRFLVIGWV